MASDKMRPDPLSAQREADFARVERRFVAEIDEVLARLRVRLDAAEACAAARSEALRQSAPEGRFSKDLARIQARMDAADAFAEQRDRERAQGRAHQSALDRAADRWKMN
jgi:hypothetical protein